jgi:hypothetical protein
VKISETKQAIDCYADGLQAAEARHTSAVLRAIAALLGEFANEQMSTAVRRGAQVGNNVKRASGSPSSEAASHIDRLAKILAAGGAKAERIKDLTSLANLLRLADGSETLDVALDRLRNAMKPETIEQRIERFIRRLKDDSGTASFDHTFAELASSSLKREHVVAVAVSVYGDIKKKTSRKDALDFIRKPHDAYVSAKRGIDATGGRSAA